jgi:hypothetical protein
MQPEGFVVALEGERWRRGEGGGGGKVGREMLMHGLKCGIQVLCIEG